MRSASPRRLRIAIATTGRFHVLDLARELEALGHEVRFYSYLPPFRTAQFGLPRRCHVFLWMLLPIALLIRYGPKWARGWLSRRLVVATNRTVARRLAPCDVFIGMSGTIVEAAEHARRRYGATIVIERGSRHVLSQAEILSALPGAEVPNAFTVERELAGYALADALSVPSVHVEKSFRERGHPPSRLIRNPYGVDLERFVPLDMAEPRNLRQVLFVGRWGLRKGADLLEQAILATDDLSLLHAGAIEDYPFPRHPRFVSVGHVDQTRLPELYASAGVLALPSREEGLALVLIQALACGLPIVCSDRSGGEDLKALIERPEAVTICPTDDLAELNRGLAAALKLAPELAGRDLLGPRGRRELTWGAYGRRYSDALQGLGRTISGEASSSASR